MVVDDYDNTDYPEVTRAVNKFIKDYEPYILNMGYRSYEMYSDKGMKRVPISKSNVYFQRNIENGER